MQQLYPEPRPLAPEQLHAGLTLPAGSSRAWIALGMVASLDGGAAVDGVTAELGGEGDRIAFSRLRAAADAILVGAGTVRDEDYGPPGGSPERRADRVSRGLAPRPRLVIVSGSLQLPSDHRVFADPDHPPLIVTHGAAPAAERRRLAALAEVADAGRDAVDLRAVAALLHDRGLRRVLCEGGPRLNGALLEADLVDEVFVTVAPLAIGGEAPRIVQGGEVAPPRAFKLVSLHEHAAELLARYRRER